MFRRVSATPNGHSCLTEAPSPQLSSRPGRNDASSAIEPCDVGRYGHQYIILVAGFLLGIDGSQPVNRGYNKLSKCLGRQPCIVNRSAPPVMVYTTLDPEATRTTVNLPRPDGMASEAVGVDCAGQTSDNQIKTPTWPHKPSASAVRMSY